MELEKIVQQQSQQIAQLTNLVGRFFSHLPPDKPTPNMVQYSISSSPRACSNVNFENSIPHDLDIAESTPITKRSVKKMAYITTQKQQLPDGSHKEYYKLHPEGTIRQRPDNGRWEIRYMDRGEQRSVSSRLQSKCLELFNQRLTERDSRPKVEKTRKQNHKLFALIDIWQEAEITAKVRTGRKREKGKISPSHAKNTRNAINYIKKHFPDTFINDIKVYELEESSAKVEFSRTREEVDIVICKFWKWAVKKEFVKKDITIDFEKHKHERERGKPFTRVHQDEILEYARQHSDYYFAFMFYFNTGARPGEIKEIRHCDFDFANKTIFIDGTKTKTSSRKVPMFSQMFKFKDQIVKGSKEHVFKMKVTTLRAELTRILVALKIASEHEVSDTDDDADKYTLKSTRHSYGTRLNEKGVDKKTISLWMGHNSLDMTDNYVHVLSEFEQLQVAKVDAGYDGCITADPTDPKSDPKNLKKVA